MYNKNEKISDYIKRIIINSWAYAKLTEQEKKTVLLLLSMIRSQTKTNHGAFQAVNTVYGEYLNILDYKSMGWRERGGEQSELKF